MATSTCPVCGSEAIERRTQPEIVKVPYAPGKAVELQVVACGSCGESGDFDNANDELIERALDEATKQSVVLMLDQLGDLGLSMAYLERSMGLPQRTLARWKAAGGSASAVALLRMVRTFPWLTKVAESDYADGVASGILVGEAITVFTKMADAHKVNYAATVVATRSEICVNALLKPGPVTSIPVSSGPSEPYTIAVI